MNRRFVPINGRVVDRDALTLPRAIATALAISAKGAFATLIECRVTEDAEVVVFDADIERPQVPINDIKRIERIAAVFPMSADSLPEALALREDFPMVPHLNLQDVAKPRSLCLYDRPWTELRHSWTGTAFVERVRLWLARTARGDLHEADQPLEPLMFSHGWDLVVPAKFGLPDGPSTLTARVGFVDGKDGRVLVSDDGRSPDRGGKTSFVMYIDTPPRTHGVIQRTPQTLADLAALVDGEGFCLIPRLREALRAVPDDIRTNQQRRQDTFPVFVLGLPKLRRGGGKVEAVELKGFLCVDTMEAVGVAVGAWIVNETALGHPLGDVEGADGSNSKAVVVNIVRELTPERAAMYSGLTRRDARRIVAIGAGALGSQVAMNLGRSGFGQWTLIDDDAFMPHNAVRHALPGRFPVGHNKAQCTAIDMNSIADCEPIAQGIRGNFLTPGDQGASIDEALAEAAVVLDMSASVAVARALSDAELPCRALSMFLSPNGQDLVLMSEDPERNIRLDDLEMAYYAEVASREELADHLEVRGAPLRYGTSCRDISVSMRQSDVGALAGIGASAFVQDVSQGQASSRVWRLDSSSLSVRVFDLAPTPFLEVEQHGWRVSVCRRMLERVRGLRKERLPDETGGILLGGVDYARRRVHLVLALASPPDSEEWPTMYIRGVHGLNDERERIVRATAGNLDYLGEWHSHPEGASTQPSEDDRKVFGWISGLSAVDGRPAVMLIVGEGGVRLFVAEFEPATSEPLCLT